MPDNGIARSQDFKRALERANLERVVLPTSGLSVLLCRPPVFAALSMGRAGTQLQARVTDAKPEEIKTADMRRLPSGSPKRSRACLCSPVSRLRQKPRTSGWATF